MQFSYHFTTNPLPFLIINISFIKIKFSKIKFPLYYPHHYTYLFYYLNHLYYLFFNFIIYQSLHYINQNPHIYLYLYSNFKFFLCPIYSNFLTIIYHFCIHQFLFNVYA